MPKMGLSMDLRSSETRGPVNLLGSWTVGSGILRLTLAKLCDVRLVLLPSPLLSLCRQEKSHLGLLPPIGR